MQVSFKYILHEFFNYHIFQILVCFFRTLKFYIRPQRSATKVIRLLEVHVFD